MRVIHHDGRVGDDLGGSATSVMGRLSHLVRWESGVQQFVRAGDFRPIGPIEEELRSSEYVDDNTGLSCNGWSDDTCHLWSDCCDSLDVDVRDDNIDADSEALEACARIWEQHGVAL